MTALTTNTSVLRRGEQTIPVDAEYPVYASTHIYIGSMVALNATGYLVPASASTALKIIGRADNEGDNSAGASGDIKVRVKLGIFKYANSGTAVIAAANRGQACYAQDDATVSRTDQGNTLAFAGIVYDVDTDGVWVYQSVVFSALSSGAVSGATEEVFQVRGASAGNIANLASFTVANDGVTLIAGNRVLLKDQSTQTQNGVYVVGAVGGGTAALTRATDFDSATEIHPGVIVVVAEGTAGGDTAWQLSSNAPITIGSSNLVFAQVPFGFGLYTAIASVTKDTAAAGTSNLAARIDHKHDITTAAAVAIAVTNAEGSATTLARSDHTHQVTTAAAVAIAVTNAEGSASSLARSDHTHQVTTASATSIDATNGAGSASSLALSDHTHEVTTRVRMVSLRIQEADLTAAATSQVINIGTAMPASARIIGVEVALATPFTGGGAGSCAVDIGTAGDPNAIVAASDVFASAVDGEASTLPTGIAPNKSVGTAQLIATVTADVNVADLTAGDLTIRVLYAVV